MSTSTEAESYGRGFNAASRAGGEAPGVGVGHVPTEWVPHSYQLPMLSIDKGIILAVGALGSGKSEPGALKLVQWALKYPRRADGRPTKWYAIGPDFSLIRQEQFGKILEHCRRIKLPGGGAVVKRVTYGIDPRIVLMNGQVILGRSASEPDRLRGHEIDGFWGDEVQEWDEKAFRIAFSRMRSAAAIRTVLTGSPEDVPGWVWHMVSGKNKGYNDLRERLAKDGTGFYAFRWKSSQNTANQEGVLGALRSVMEASAATAAAQDLEGRFPGTDEAPLLTGEIDHAAAFVGRRDIAPSQAVGFSLGLDIGEIRDFTWLTVLSRDGVVLHMERFNASTPGVPRKGFYPYVEKRAERVARHWGVKVVVVDVAKAGAGVAQHLAIAFGGLVSVVSVDTGVPAKKSDLIEREGTALSRGDVVIPTEWSDGTRVHQVQWRDYLQKELSELQPNDSGKGKRRWDHPPGGHDDGPVSLGLAYHGLSAGRVSGMFKRDWLRYATHKAGQLHLGTVVLEGKTLVRFAVFVAPDAEKPDDVPVIAVFGADAATRRLVLLDVVREALDGAEIAPKIRDVAKNWGCRTTFVGKRDASAAVSLATADAMNLSRLLHEARGAGLSVAEVSVATDRATRALPVTSALSGGSLWFLADASWLGAIESELLEFPGGPHGNQVDCLAHAVQVFNELVVASSAEPGGQQQIRTMG